VLEHAPRGGRALVHKVSDRTPGRATGSKRGRSNRKGGIYCLAVESACMSTPTKITLGTIGTAALLAVALVLVLLS